MLRFLLRINSDSLLRHARSHLEEEQRARHSHHSTEEDLSSQAADTLSDLLNPNVDTDNSRIFQSNAAITTPSFTQSSPSTQGHQGVHPMPYEYDSTLDVGGLTSWSAPSSAQPINNNDQFPLLTGNLDRSEATHISMATSWMFSPSHQFPGWLVDEDFDLSALCATIPPSGTSLPMDLSGQGFFASDRLQMNDSSDRNIIIEAPSDVISESKEERVKRSWFTYLGTERSGQITPDGINQPTSVDERYREDLSRELQQRRITYEPLPSTDFLV